MKKWLMTSAAAAALVGSCIAYTAFAAPGEPEPGPRHYGMEDREFMLDARLAGMKAALKLTADQDKLWAPFESAVRDIAKSRGEEARAMHEKDARERPSPIDRMNEMADRMAKESADLSRVAGAAKPLFDALDETGKRHFGPLLMSLREPPPPPHPPHPPMDGPGGPRPGEDMQ